MFDWFTAPAATLEASFPSQVPPLPEASQIATREEWLRQAAILLSWKMAWAEVPVNLDNTPIAVGFPSMRDGSSGRVLGVCHGEGSALKRELRPIFITPTSAEPIEVLATLLHELVHAALPSNVGHRAPFVRAVRALGLAGKPTATYAEEGTPLWFALRAIVSHLGAYPHIAMKAKVKPNTKKWVRFRSLTEPSYIADVLMSIVEEHGAPRDPWGKEMALSSRAKNASRLAHIGALAVDSEEDGEE